MTALAYRFDQVDELPPETVAAAADAARVFARHSSAPRVRLRVEDDDDGSIVLPADILKQFVHLLAQIANGQAVSIVPVHAELTTQQAAHYLNVSRPHVIKLIERGDLPHRMVGTHRKLLARDVLNYADRVSEQRKRALIEMAGLERELGIDDIGMDEASGDEC